MNADEDDLAISTDEKEVSIDITSEIIEKTEEDLPVPSNSAVRSCWGRITSLPTKSPRLFSIVFRIILPLWFIIGLSIVGGHFLAQFEAKNELDTNDLIMAHFFTLEVLSLENISPVLLNLPVDCYKTFLEEVHIRGTNVTLKNITFDSVHFSDWTLADLKSSKIDLEFGEIIWLDVFSNLLGYHKSYLEECVDKAEAVIHKMIQIRENASIELAGQELSFNNWNRCWNVSEEGSQYIFSPTRKQIRAAGTQDIFYEKSWKQDQQRLQEEYSEQQEGAGSSLQGIVDNLSALVGSIKNATGRQDRVDNVPGAAWFWFTVMTTVGTRFLCQYFSLLIWPVLYPLSYSYILLASSFVGYGTQVPVTLGGRTMVSSLGFLSILVFGGILVSSGSIVRVIFDDLVNRCNLRVLTRPLVAILLWGATAWGWMIVLATTTYRWWQIRLDEEEEKPTMWWDSVWFAYISTTTVGLGDLFLQPEMIFLEDLFAFSLLFLTGFVLLSTFLSEFADLLGGMFPHAGEKLKERVRKTSPSPLALEADSEEAKESVSEKRQSIDILKKLVDQGECDDRDLAMVIKEEELLKLLLEKKNAERMQLE